MTPPPSSIVLLWGEDPYLLRTAALELAGDRRITEVDAAEWRGSELQDLATPSLFGESRALIVTDLRALPKEAMTELAAYLSAPDPDAPLILCCTVAERGKPPAALLKLVEPVGRVTHLQLQRKLAHFWPQSLDGRERQRQILGLVRATQTGPQARIQPPLRPDLDPTVRPSPQPDLQRQFRGLSEQKTWDLCDKAFGKDLPGAIRSLRSIEEGGDEAIMVLGGIAARLRDLIRVRSLPDRLPPAQLAKAAGLRFDWQARRYQQQARNFSLDELVEIHRRVVDADEALKSGATGGVVMPALIASIAA